MKQYLTIGILVLFGVAALVFTTNDAFLYNDIIAKVVEVDNSLSHEEEGPNDETERYYDQKIKARVLNGKHKGTMVELENTYTDSGVNDERYYRGNQLFITISGENGSIQGKKRDTYLVLFLFVFLVLLLVVNRKHGVIVFVSAVINVILFLMALRMYDGNGNLLNITIILMLIFCMITLLFAGGCNKKTFTAILSTLLTSLICWLIYEIVLKTSDRLPYEMMDYIVNSKDLADLFLAGTLMGSLGAIMDVSISISAGVAEVVQKTPNLTGKALIRSIREMGYDIMGTMINVLFFTYMTGSIPILVVKIKNGYTLYHLVQFQLVFELICFLMGAIGIVLAIPVAGFFSAVFLGKKDRKRSAKL